MIRSFLTVSSGTLASRLLGFVRDSLVAALLGAGPVADAFLVAFQLVNVVRRLLTEGALNAALVPAWLRIRETEGAAAAAAFAGRLLGTVSAALIAATALIGLLMPLVLTALAPGFVGTETLQLAVSDARLMLPYLAFAGPVTVLMALMNAQGRFALTAFSPLLFNIALIAVTIVLLMWRQDATFGAFVLAATVGIAGLLQLFILTLRRSGGVVAWLRVSLDGEMREFFAKAVPGMIASSGPQLLMVASAVIASSSPSAVSWLYFANRLIELPLGLVGVAMGTVLIPELSRAVHRDDADAISQAESRGLELAAGLALPATLGLLVLSEPIVRMLFEHGAFTAGDTASTGKHHHAAGGGVEGRRSRYCGELPVRPSVWPRRHRRRHRPGRLEQRAVVAARGRRDNRIFTRPRGTKAPAAHRRGRIGDGRPVVASGKAAAGRRPAWRCTGQCPLEPDCRRDRALRPAAAAFRRHRLARGC